MLAARGDSSSQEWHGRPARGLETQEHGRDQPSPGRYGRQAAHATHPIPSTVQHFCELAGFFAAAHGEIGFAAAFPSELGRKF